MQKISLHHNWARFFAILLLIVIGFPTAKRAAAQTPNGYVFMVGAIELNELGVDNIQGLAYSPGADVLLAIQNQTANGVRPVALIDRIEELRGMSELQAQPADVLNTAFNDQNDSLFTFDTATQELTQTAVNSDGSPSPASSRRTPFNLRLGIQRAQGMDFDSATGRLFILDTGGKLLWVISPDQAGNYNVDTALAENRAKRVNLRGIAKGALRGLAFNPNSGTLFTFNQTYDTLFEITDNGELVNTRDVSSFREFHNPAGMVFAPSGDTTDDPQTKNLYIADPSANTIVELSITAVEVMALPAASPISLVNTIDTSKWNPPAPDTSGIDYDNVTNRLLISDSEVEEMPIYQGKNVFSPTLSGNLQSTCDTTAFNKEPSGLAIDASTGDIYISNDGKKIVYQVRRGSDGQYCTGDDQVRSFNVGAYGVVDPEGIGFGEGKLFIADGKNAEVWRVSPGPNGVFDGGGDDSASHFDSASMGLRDPEGIEYHPTNGTLFVVSRGDQTLVEVSQTGTVQRIFDISFVNAVDPAGLGIGPGSNNASVLNVYMVQRGLDNNDFPKENDGKVYELNVGDGGGGGPTPTPTPTFTPTPTPPPGSVNLYLSLASSGTGALSFAKDEDIVRFNGSSFSQFFDGSDVGVGGVDVDAFSLIGSSTLLLSFDSPVTLPNVGAVDDFDVVQFTATSFGDNTAGTFSMYFDGEDVGLSASSEDIDAIDRLPNGILLISTSGNASVPNASGADEDMLAFTPTSLGATTNGTWSLYFDGSDVGLATDSGEDIDGLSVTNNGVIYLSTRGVFAVTGVSGTASDIFSCTPVALGATTNCTFSSSLFFTGANWGLSTNNVDGIELYEP